MKMKLVAFLAFALLSIAILSYGVNGSVFADSHNIPPISASTELPTYGNGGKVVVSGDIRDYDSVLHVGQDITFVIKSPTNNLVTIGQITPSSDGSFQVNFTAGGNLWKSSGDYIIEFHFGSNSGETTIVYSGGDVPTSVTCTSNETLVNGVCIENEPAEIVTCTSNETLVNGVCIENEPAEIVTCTSNETLVNGVCIENEPDPECGTGTILKDGICVIDTSKTPDDSPKTDGGCLIATAAYGTELAPQVQLLREIRDNQLMNTESGTAFMSTFNQFYYSFSPIIADMERENPMFQQTVRAFITPLIYSLSIMTLADGSSEAEVLGLGISVIALNLGLYIVAPAAIGFTISRKIKSRK